MEKVSIFIDHTGTDEDLEFSTKLKERLKSIKYDFDIMLFDDYDYDDSQNENEWERVTVEAINKATIVIPIISAGYIAFVTPSVETALDTIIDTADRFLFPVLLKPTNWGGLKWIVRSKLTPSNETPISEQSTNDVDKIINSFVKTISTILAKYHEKPEQEVVTQSPPKKTDNFIFISHDHDDADFAELLKLKLEKEDLNGWIDSERLKIGQDWREEIDAGIENSLAVIAIMTPDARKSEYVTYEWAFAWGKGKNIFPIMLKQTQLHPRLESLQYLDFTNRTTRPWEELIDSIKELI